MHDASFETDRVTVLTPVKALPVASAYAALAASAIADRRVALHERLSLFETRSSVIGQMAAVIVASLRAGGKVLVAGNGGSAAEAQHFAGELVGRFKLERRAYAAIALCVDSAIVTAVGNDYGFAEIFARQVLALGRPGDVLLAYSTSGESENVVAAALAAHRCGMTVAAVTGDAPSRLEQVADLTLRVPDTDTPIVQELQMMVTHILCGIVEAELAMSDLTGVDAAVDG